MPHARWASTNFFKSSISMMDASSGASRVLTAAHTMMRKLLCFLMVTQRAHMATQPCSSPLLLRCRPLEYVPNLVLRSMCQTALDFSSPLGAVDTLVICTSALSHRWLCHA